MYEGKINGSTLRFSDEAYKSMKSRFNPNQLEPWTNKIDRKCRLCSMYRISNVGCSACPFRVFERDDSTDAGCSHVLHKLCGKSVYRTISPSYDAILIKGNIDTARRYFQKIQDWLDTFKKVKK